MPKLCEFENCRNQASYGLCYGKPTRCKDHKEDYKLTKLTSSKCQHEGCKLQPVFNFEGETKGKFCSTHKEEGMVDVKHDKCQHEGCKSRPHFNFEEESRGKFCGTHKVDGMVDVKNKRCEHEGCKLQPNFNFEEESRGKFCSTHKEEGMVDVKHEKCKSNACLGTRANNKFKGYCTACFQHLFPLDPLTFQIRSKTKEIAVRDYINSNFEGFQHDKPLFTGNCDCTHRRRIDHRVLIGNTLLCIETDESQHKTYNKKNEEIRYDDLYMIHSGKFVFIRFNPDKFKDKHNISVNPMLYMRLHVLKKEIQKQIERIRNEENKELLEIIKLYYDDNN
jgi:hypothetical protein